MEVVINYELAKKAKSAKCEYNKDKRGRSYGILSELSRKLQDISIYTSSDLLINLAEYSRRYKLITGGFPKIVISRTLIVPTYTYGSLVSSEKVIEEHSLLSKKYILSRDKK